MRVNLDGWRFEVPAGFDDWTNYTFESPVQHESLNVTYGLVPLGVRSVDELLSNRHRDVETALEGHAQIEEPTTTVLDGLDARTLTFETGDAGERFRERWVMAIDTIATFFQVAYAWAADNADAPARFDHILKSVARHAHPIPMTPPGYIRRWGGQLTLDVPTHLRSPRTYVFVDEPHQLRLEVSAYDPATAKPPSLEQEAQRDTLAGDVVVHESTTTYGTLRASGMVTRYGLANRSAPTKVTTVVIRAQLTLLKGLRVSVCARAPASARDGMDRSFQQFVASLE